MVMFIQTGKRRIHITSGCPDHSLLMSLCIRERREKEESNRKPQGGGAGEGRGVDKRNWIRLCCPTQKPSQKISLAVDLRRREVTGGASS